MDDVKNQFDFEKIWFFLDGQERDRMDSAHLSAKNGQIMALKQKLLALPSTQFDAAMTMITKLVDDSQKKDSQKKDSEDKKKKATLELFQKPIIEPDFKVSLSVKT